jgi:hypothetical protein
MKSTLLECWSVKWAYLANSSYSFRCRLKHFLFLLVLISVWAYPWLAAYNSVVLNAENKYEKVCAKNFPPFYCALVIITNKHCGIRSSAPRVPKPAIVRDHILPVLTTHRAKIHDATVSLVVFQKSFPHHNFTCTFIFPMHGVRRCWKRRKISEQALITFGV